MSVRRHQGEARPTVRVIESLSRFDETPDKLLSWNSPTTVTGP
jgi:hypothetical protein